MSNIKIENCTVNGEPIPDMNRALKPGETVVLGEESKSIIYVVITTLPSGDVDSRAYYENGDPIIGKDFAGEDYHLGQISSNVQWARADMEFHFEKEWNDIFPKGWVLSFSVV